MINNIRDIIEPHSDKGSRHTADAASQEYEAVSKKGFALRLALSIAAGGIIGFLTTLAYAHFSRHKTINADGIISILNILQIRVLPVIMLCTVLISGIMAEHCLKKGKLIIDGWDGEDDLYISKADHMLNISITMLGTLTILIQILFAAITYNMFHNMENNIKSSFTILAAVAVYLSGFAISIIQQNRILKQVKRYSPEKEGSIYDKNFNRVWLGSCDEAEQKIIGIVSYKTYKFMSGVFSIFLTAATIIGMFLPIGILAAVFTGALWLLMTGYYGYTATKLEGRI